MPSVMVRLIGTYALSNIMTKGDDEIPIPPPDGFAESGMIDHVRINAFPTIELKFLPLQK